MPHSEIIIAILSKNIIIHYQPILDNISKEIHKYEALMRLESQGKIIYPNDFLPLSKRTGTYIPLSKEMFRLLMQKLDEEPQLYLSFNISMIDIDSEEMRTYILEGFKALKEPHRVTLEITEFDEVDFVKSTVFFNEVKAFGVKVSIDDFGSGYANFENLLHFEFDYLKLDGKFISNIYNPHHESIIKAILHYCEHNKTVVIAEYVESEKIFNRVCEMGIQYSQGYYIGKPKDCLIEEKIILEKAV